VIPVRRIDHETVSGRFGRVRSSLLALEKAKAGQLFAIPSARMPSASHVFSFQEPK
jgi:hypothetical protein